MKRSKTKYQTEQQYSQVNDKSSQHQHPGIYLNALPKHLDLYEIGQLVQIEPQEEKIAGSTFEDQGQGILVRLFCFHEESEIDLIFSLSSVDEDGVFSEALNVIASKLMKELSTQRNSSEQVSNDNQINQSLDQLLSPPRYLSTHELSSLISRSPEKLCIDYQLVTQDTCTPVRLYILAKRFLEVGHA